MSGLVLLVPLASVAVIVALIATVVVPGRRALPPAGDGVHRGLARLRRVTLASRISALVVGVALLVAAASTGGLGRGLMLAPVLFGGCQVLGVLLADAIAHRSARTPGTAAVEVRRVRDFLPTALTRVVIASGIVLGGCLIWTTALASADDQGRRGRALSYACTTDCARASVGPWPGSYYSAPLAIGLFIVVALTLLAVRFTAARPRNGADPEILRVDGAIRRRSVESALAGAGVALVGSLAGIAAVVGLRLLDAQHAPSGLSAAALPAAIVAGLALVGLIWCVALLVVPGPSGARRR